MDRSLAFNNAGAQALSHGHSSVALELFRGALETKLAHERLNPPPPEPSMEEEYDYEDEEYYGHEEGMAGGLYDKGAQPESPPERCVTPECVVRAENHLSRMDEYTIQNATDESHPTSEPPSDSPAVPYESRGFDPYLYELPFHLPSNGTASTQLTSAIIVFNLGLVHHLASRTSAKAAAFYEIAAALLAGEVPAQDSALLRVVLLNNFGAWSYENGDGESLRTCAEHLSTLVREARQWIDPQVERQVQRNVDWLLTPPTGGSPAA